MKTIETNGITFIKPVPDGTSEWYYGISYEHGDLYEAEEIFKNGGGGQRPGSVPDPLPGRGDLPTGRKARRLVHGGAGVF